MRVGYGYRLNGGGGGTVEELEDPSKVTASAIIYSRCMTKIEGDFRKRERGLKERERGNERSKTIT